ncbi:MAG: hypothetical protein ACF8XB_10260, partial [Planctomycetota bacterium JB042]
RRSSDLWNLISVERRERYDEMLRKLLKAHMKPFWQNGDRPSEDDAATSSDAGGGADRTDEEADDAAVA